MSYSGPVNGFMPVHPSTFGPPMPPTFIGDPGMVVQPDPTWPGDPGIFVQPDPTWPGDPGIVARPGSEWVNPGIYWRDPDRNRIPVPESDVLIDRSAMPTGIERLSTGDMIKAGAAGFVVPSLLGGVIGGALAASMVAGAGLRTAAFSTMLLRSTIGGIATGAGAGLLVAASKPKEGDSLGARYALAAGGIGAVSGAITPGPFRAANVIIGGLVGGFIGNAIGNRTQRQAEAAN